MRRSLIAVFRLCAISLASFAISAQASAQGEPFGLRMGMSVAEITRLTDALPDKEKRGIYRATRVPQPHAAFESYTFVIAPSTGLCKVWGTGKTIENDAYGNALHSSFDALQDVLDQKYGPHKNYDALNDGSIWNEPREWMMALKQNERRLTSFWGTLENAGKPPAPVTAVQLKASGLNSSSGWLTLYYEFANIDKCLAEIQKMQNSSL